MKRPAALGWYALYCYLSAGFNIFLAGSCLHLLQNARGVSAQIIASVPPDQASFYEVMASPEVLTKMSLPLLANFLFFTGVNVWLPHAPRAKNWHTIHLINLILGALTCVLAPLCVPVALAWTKPEVKAWFASSADAEP